MKTLVLFIAALLINTGLYAQKLISKNGHIWFYSHTAVEDIEAHNHQSVSILDKETGDIQFSLLVKSFEFEKKLMQEHFNENYMESDEFPKASFNGKIINLNSIDFEKDGIYKANVEGSLTIHGVTKNITTAAMLTIKNKKVSAKSEFILVPKNYNIEIPNVVEEKIAKEITVNIENDYN